MRLKDLLSQFLFAFVNISVELVSILTDRKLLVVVDRNVDFLSADWLVFRVMELLNVGMF